jgi:hypothetical protein
MSSMTLDDLIVEAETISEQAFALYSTPQTDDTEIHGYWGGERSDRPNEVPEWVVFESIRHICTVRETIIQKIYDAPSSLGLFEYEYKDETPPLVNIEFPECEWQEIEFSGTPLYQKPIQSFPPLEAVLLYGGTNIQNWFQELGLKRYQYGQIYRDETNRKLISDFSQIWFERTQILEQDATLIVGGWHKFWSDDCFYIPKEAPLIFQTLQDAEPWYECFAANYSNFFVKERIT